MLVERSTPECRPIAHDCPSYLHGAALYSKSNKIGRYIYFNQVAFIKAADFKFAPAAMWPPMRSKRLLIVCPNFHVP